MKRRFLDFVGLRLELPFAETFFQMVCQHPALCVPPSETYYFSSDKITKGPAWYEAHFEQCGEGIKRGEIATSYLATPGTAARLAREYADARVMALICDPLEAIATSYVHATKGAAAGGLEAYLEKHPLLLPQYKFGKQLTAYFSYYSTVDLMVVTFDDVRADPVRIFKMLYSHLEVDVTFLPKVLRVLAEEEETHPSWWTRRLRLDRLKARRRAVRVAASAAVFPPAKLLLTAKERILLARYYEQDVRELSALLNRDLLGEWGYPKSETLKKK